MLRKIPIQHIVMNFFNFIPHFKDYNIYLLQCGKSSKIKRYNLNIFNIGVLELYVRINEYTIVRFNGNYVFLLLAVPLISFYVV